jgi:PAS domain S-box-containing protein
MGPATHQDWMGRVHRDDREQTEAAIRRAVEAGGDFDIEFRIQRPDGTTRWINNVGKLLLGDDNRPTGMYGLQIDITERKEAELERARAEAELQASRDYLDRLMNTLADPVFTVELATRRISYVNEATRSVLGYSPDELIDRTTRLLYQTDEAFRAFGDKIRAARDARTEQFRTELILVRKDGVPIWCDVHVSLDISGEESAAVISVIRDVSDRRRAEEALRRSEVRFERAFRFNPAAMAILDIEEGRYLDANHRFLELFELELVDIIDRRQREVGIWPDPDEFPELLERLRVEPSQRDLELELRSQIGERRLVVADFELIELEGGPCLLMLLDDVTEERRLQEALRQAQKLEAVGRLAGGIAHDFNNLLTAITGTAQLLMVDLADRADLVEPLEDVLEAAERGAALVRQLLAFSRRQPVHPEVLDLNEVVAETEKMLTRLIGEDIRLKPRPAAEPVLVELDPVQLEQVLLNLALNARDAMPTGGELSVETSRRQLTPTQAKHRPGLSPGRHAVLTVRDTGHGMDPQTLSRIFEPFYTTKQRSNGTGLGLATVYGIVSQSGGHIEVESQVGRGTTFSIYWPEATEPPREAGRADVRGAVSEGGETVLVVEDEAIVRGVVVRMLQALGYVVLAAEDGPSALALAEAYEGRIDVLLTDVIMPEMHGPSLATQLRAGRPEMTVLFMSGYSESTASVQWSREDGPLLPKPFKPGELARRLRDVLDKRGEQS